MVKMISPGSTMVLKKILTNETSHIGGRPQNAPLPAWPSSPAVPAEPAEAMTTNAMSTGAPAGPADAINAAAVLLGATNVRILGNQGRGPILVSRQHPVRLHLVPPALPVADRPALDAHNNVVSQGNWGIMGDSGLMFAGGQDSGGMWYLTSGELQFRGSIAVGPYLVVFLSGEIESTAPGGGACIEGSVAQVDGVEYELVHQVWLQKM
jgi:hypothetical protein